MNYTRKLLVKLGLIGIILAVVTVSYIPVTVTASSDVISIGVGQNNQAIVESKDTSFLAPSVITDNGNGTYTYQNKWLSSYETIYFTSPDQDINIGEYALDESKTIYYIRTKPKNSSQFESVPIVDPDTGIHYDVSSLNLIKTDPKKYTYYDEFLTAQGAIDLWTPTSQYYLANPSQLPSGDVVRVQSDATKYKKLGTIPDAPQPSRTEITTTSDIPVEPPQPHNTPHSIAFDATSNSGDQGAVSSYAWNHTCGVTANLLVLGDSHYGASGVTVTGITYNGSPMTHISGADAYIYDNKSTGAYFYSTIFYLLAPATGSAYSVSVTYSATAYGSIAGGVVSYSGASQSGQPDNSNHATGAFGVTNPTVNVITQADNCWVFSTVLNYSSLYTSGNTQRWKVTQDRCGGSDTNGVVHPAGSQTMSWTGAKGPWVISAASFAPAVEAAYDISNDPSTKAFGIVAPSTTYYAKGSAPANPVEDENCTYTLTNSGSTAKISVHGHTLAGGVDWTLGSDVGENVVKITVYTTGDNPASGVVVNGTDQTLIASLAAGTRMWDFRMDMGTFTDGVAKSGNLTLTASAP